MSDWLLFTCAVYCLAAQCTIRDLTCGGRVVYERERNKSMGPVSPSKFARMHAHRTPVLQNAACSNVEGYDTLTTVQ